MSGYVIIYENHNCYLFVLSISAEVMCLDILRAGTGYPEKCRGRSEVSDSVVSMRGRLYYRHWCVIFISVGKTSTSISGG